MHGDNYNCIQNNVYLFLNVHYISIYLYYFMHNSMYNKMNNNSMKSYLYNGTPESSLNQNTM